MFRSAAWKVSLLVGFVVILPVASISAAGSERRPYFDLIRQILEAPAGEQPGAADAAAKDELVQSEEWLAVRSWLDDYYAVQVEYSDDEIALFDERLSQMSTAELQSFLAKFRRNHGELLKRAEASKDLRTNRLGYARDSRSRSAAIGTSARRYHFQAGVSRPVAAQRQRRRYYAYPPLITSREVARISVLNEFWGW